MHSGIDLFAHVTVFKILESGIQRREAHCLMAVLLIVCTNYSPFAFVDPFFK